LTPGSI